MILIIKHEIFISPNISHNELSYLYSIIGGWYALFFFDYNESRYYMIETILNFIGKNVNIVTLEKENLFTKLKKIIKFKRFNVPYKEENGITKEDYFHVDFKFDKKYTYHFNYDLKNFEKDFKNSKKKDFKNSKENDFKNSKENESFIQKKNDLNIFEVEYNENNISERHMFLINNLKKIYYKQAKKTHPDKGGDVEKFKELFNVYEKLIKLKNEY
uniref:J domain-containing protein n=1 Tax=viral metagenome TaxID=1070528 RepID=A0A6C0AF48_9ZZZZ